MEDICTFNMEKEVEKIEVPTNPITSGANPPESTAYMNFNGFKFKITHNSFTVDKEEKKKKSKVSSYKNILSL